MERYDITFIGAGPSTIYSVLRLVELNYKGSICIVEKGPRCEERDKNNVLSAFGGAGLTSDYKLSSSLEVGGHIPDLTEQEYSNFENWLLNKINSFKKFTKYPNEVNWQNTSVYNTKDSGLTWDVHHTCHLGTDVGLELNKIMQDYLLKQPNVNIKFKTNIVDVDYEHDIDYIDGAYKLIDDKGNYFYTNKLVLATGRFGTLPGVVMNKFKPKLKPRPFSLGIRVKDVINDTYKDIINCNYDFKFVKKYDFGDIKCKVRTFCANSGAAFIAAEKSQNGFTSFNGHAYKNKENNGTVNYGIVCEISGLEEYKTKEQQIELMKKINQIPSWKQDNFKNGIIDPSRKLLDGFDHLKGVYPKEIIEALTDFVQRLNTLVDLSKATYCYPEVKLSDMIPEINPKTLETSIIDTYMIGDCIFSGSISKAAYLGYSLANHLGDKDED